jgi:hypothetical protein
VEIFHLSMLNFVESPGNHRYLLFDVSTRAPLGKFRYKICHHVSPWLVTTQVDSVKHYNEIVWEQFEIHRIFKRMDAVDQITRYCGYPSPRWLCLMIIKLYKQMTKIRIHAGKKCRKILKPENNFGPTVQMWYDRIHPYLQLIRMKKGKTKNTGYILRFARQQHINAPEMLTLDELKDGLQFTQIRKADLRKQAKGLPWVHLQHCLINAKEKKHPK